MKFCVRKMVKVLVRIWMCIWYDPKVKFLDFWCPVDPWSFFNFYDGLGGSFRFHFETFETCTIFLRGLKKVFCWCRRYQFWFIFTHGCYIEMGLKIVFSFFFKSFEIVNFLRIVELWMTYCSSGGFSIMFWDILRHY